ncbi:unnamed protein product [Lactuca virosa]|uniref:Uncharacterized protein n=1 Tax=Lactuca virosa TaxID=75947 RepID=A0AAU9MSX8_9ASTR|nr:unnamed protein product [Lactuca virosa]
MPTLSPLPTPDTSRPALASAAGDFRQQIWDDHPPFLELFLFTHLDKASKKKYFAGDVEGKQFLHRDRASEAYEVYSRSLLEKYGDDFHDHPIDDAELWAKTQREISGASRSSYIYRIGILGYKLFVQWEIICCYGVFIVLLWVSTRG